MSKKEDWPPKGYLDHGELAREDYPELYAAIAKAYAKPQKKFKLQDHKTRRRPKE